jgi:hypothetical protein
MNAKQFSREVWFVPNRLTKDMDNDCMVEASVIR